MLPQGSLFSCLPRFLTIFSCPSLGSVCWRQGKRRERERRKETRSPIRSPSLSRFHTPSLIPSLLFLPSPTSGRVVSSLLHRPVVSRRLREEGIGKEELSLGHQVFNLCCLCQMMAEALYPFLPPSFLFLPHPWNREETCPAAGNGKGRETCKRLWKKKRTKVNEDSLPS